MRVQILFLIFLGVAGFAAAQSPTPQTPPKPTTAHAANPDADAQLYRNDTFGFRYKVRYGWVDRTKEMNGGEMNGEAGAQPKASQGEVLLATFERPPDAPGDTINSAVVIVAESVSAYPGLKKAEDYLGPLTELATAKGFKPAGEPEDITIDARPLIRADFAKPLGPAKAPTATDPAKDNGTLTMHQSTLVLLAKGQIVSFTFIAGSEDEIDDLIEALHFGPAGRR